MNVQNVMSSKLTIVEPQTSITQAASFMRKNNVGWLPVCSGGRIEGVLTDRDICIRCTATDMDPKSTTCRQIMTKNVFCCHIDESVQEAVDMMEDKKVRRLAVLDSQDRLCGVVSMSDVATKAHDRQLAGEVMEQICAAPASV